MTMRDEGILIRDRWLMTRLLGQGTTGKVFLGVDKTSGEEVAIKLADEYMLDAEICAYHNLCGGVGFPRLYDEGYYFSNQFMIITLLGPTIQDLLTFCSGRFNAFTVKMLGHQLVERLRSVHEKGFTHGTVKPENLCMGLQDNRETLHLIDFGSCSKINGTSRSRRSSAYWISLNRHEGVRHCMRDDMESCLYTLLYMIHGSLPWTQSGANYHEQKRLHAQTICESHGLGDVWSYIRGLQKGAVPNYAYIREELTKLKDDDGNELSWKKVRFI